MYLQFVGLKIRDPVSGRVKPGQKWRKLVHSSVTLSQIGDIETNWKFERAESHSGGQRVTVGARETCVSQTQGGVAPGTGTTEEGPSSRQRPGEAQAPLSPPWPNQAWDACSLGGRRSRAGPVAAGGRPGVNGEEKETAPTAGTGTQDQQRPGLGAAESSKGDPHSSTGLQEER